jgi:parvulin-like peptidyl-prolyl isomerase
MNLARIRIGRIGAAAAAVIILPTLLGLTACDRGKRGTVIARVEGKDIMLAHFADFYRPPPSLDPDPEIVRAVVKEKLEELIGFTLIQEAGRADGLHKTRDFNLRREEHEKDLLNRILKQRLIVDQIIVDPAAVDTFMARSRKERHVQHIVTLTAGAAEDVKKRLQEGEAWDALARIYSRDAEVLLHGGDLGWVMWGVGQFTHYPDLQEQVFSQEVGTWQGPIESSGEFHFLNIVEENERVLGTDEEERRAAHSRLSALIQRDLEQQFSNEMWARGEYHLDEDHFRWLVEEIQASFEMDPGRNPIPELSKEDLRRVIVRSPIDPYTAEELLARLALRSPSSRDNAITPTDWRRLFIEWILTDEGAAEARERGFDKDPGFRARRETFIDSRLYALKLEEMESEPGIPTDEDLEAYVDAHPEEFNIPETRQIIEVLLATREEAEEILERALAGEDMENLAYEHTIREDFANRYGRFAAIAPGEFGALGEAAFESEQGDLGPIVETPLGFSVFKVQRIAPPRVVELNQVREDLRIRLTGDWSRENIERFKSEARARGRVWLNEELLGSYAENITAFVIARRAAEADSAASPGDRGGMR